MSHFKLFSWAIVIAAFLVAIFFVLLWPQKIYVELKTNNYVEATDKALEDALEEPIIEEVAIVLEKPLLKEEELVADSAIFKTVMTTVFWVGESAEESNDFQNSYLR